MLSPSLIQFVSSEASSLSLSPCPHLAHCGLLKCLNFPPRNQIQRDTGISDRRHNVNSISQIPCYSCPNTATETSGMGESDQSKLIEAGDTSQLFRIEQSEDKGRFLVATRDIKPLELIIR